MIYTNPDIYHTYEANINWEKHKISKYINFTQTLAIEPKNYSVSISTNDEFVNRNQESVENKMWFLW